MNRETILLNKFYGYNSFKEGQYEVISNIVKGKDCFCVLPTGGGKSICYQIPALLFQGLTVVVSPLVSLMKNQVDTLVEIGISSDYIHGGLSIEEIEDILKKSYSGEIKILYIAPERLENNFFINKIAKINISQIAIDEAHCVSVWGHDFRKSYLNIARFIDSLPKRPIITAFTATATNQVLEDSIKLLNLNKPFVFRGSSNRENLQINIHKEEDKLEFISDFINSNEESYGIVYCLTTKEVDGVYDYLKERGYKVGKYHGKMPIEKRNYYQEEFDNDNINIMVATNAFGMGIDKSNISFVIHFTIPKNLESYYQEIGRGGRDGEKVYCHMLYNRDDISSVEYLINSSVEFNRREVELRKLQKLIELCEFDGCYRYFILKYFSEENIKDYCNSCSNCFKNEELRDMTIEAQKILSCVYRTKEEVGESVLVDILRGVRGPKVEERKYFELSTFAIMKEYSSTLIRDIISELISQGYLSRKENTYSMVRLNEKSLSVLTGKENVFIKLEEKSTDLCLDQELFKRFRILRKDLSRRENVKPYIIFTDNLLIEIVNNYPKTKEELAKVNGLGEQKLNKYGSFILTVIRDYEKYKKES